MEATPENILSPENTEWRTIIEQQIGPDFFKDLARSQSPRLLWIGCADSRVPETIIMAARPGDIFVHRNIANQFHLSDDSAQSVLAFGVENLEIQNIVVVGHTDCGGAAACLAAASGQPAPENPSLARWLKPMTELARSLDLGSVPEDQRLNRLIDANVKAQVANVVKTDTIQNAWKNKRDVVVHGWVFEIGRGTIRDLCISATNPNLGGST